MSRQMKERLVARILVIDDEEPIRDLIRALFEPEGLEILQAPDGEAGLEAFRRRHPDMVITDIIMERLDGFEVIKELRRQGSQVKIIAIAGRGDALLTRAMTLGADRALGKPFRLEELRSAVHDLLDNCTQR